MSSGPCVPPAHGHASSRHRGLTCPSPARRQEARISMRRTPGKRSSRPRAAHLRASAQHALPPPSRLTACPSKPWRMVLSVAIPTMSAWTWMRSPHRPPGSSPCTAISLPDTVSTKGLVSRSQGPLTLSTQTGKELVGFLGGLQAFEDVNSEP